MALSPLKFWFAVILIHDDIRLVLSCLDADISQRVQGGDQRGWSWNLGCAASLQGLVRRDRHFSLFLVFFLLLLLVGVLTDVVLFRMIVCRRLQQHIKTLARKVSPRFHSTFA